ncbi:pentapeptide repeat-containing protein [Photobacterium sp. GJ3]|uniref:pentapeptide repeat-containing protein n=1 Tax=Photobacterium sp. GJ3 TaxID=2829502 RepID=UPI001B8AB0C0|nr:pentapeptide repeat-containing protein [Photobacterium sp. GJ3]QUJ68481.1 pentapeptide repeat-containing protein [Photobacterium sp. GJ3]
MYAIPFLGFSVDVVSFFIFAPLFVFFLTYIVNSSLFEHCKLLLTYLNKINKPSYSILTKERTNNINLNFINRIYNNNSDLEEKIIVISISILLSIIPIFIQFYLLARFLDYQDMAISLYHLIMVFSTYLISAYYWLRTSNPEYIVGYEKMFSRLLFRLRNKIYYKKKSPTLCIACRSLAMSLITISLFYFLTIQIHPSIFEIINSSNNINPIPHFDYSKENILLSDKNNLKLLDIKSIIIQNYPDFVFNIIGLVSISIFCRNITSILITTVMLFITLEIPVILYFLDILVSYNCVKSYLENFEIVYFIFILSIITLKSEKIRLLLHHAESFKTLGSIKHKFPIKDFSGIKLWSFIEISTTNMFLVTSVILITLLSAPLFLEKFYSEKITFIKNIYPNINVSEKQIFELSKSAQLFEINNSDTIEFTKNIQTLNKCVSLSHDICHFIEPFIINKRNLRFSDFTDSRVYQVRISNSDLSYSNFYNAHLDGSKIEDSKLIHTNFAYAKLHGSNLVNVILNNSKMKYTDISSTKITDSQLKNLNMCYISLKNSNINKNIISCSEHNKDKHCNCNVDASDLSPSIFKNNRISDIKVDFLNHETKITPTIILINNKSIDSNKYREMEFHTTDNENLKYIYNYDSDIKIIYPPEYGPSDKKFQKIDYKKLIQDQSIAEINSTFYGKFLKKNEYINPEHHPFILSILSDMLKDGIEYKSNEINNKLLCTEKMEVRLINRLVTKLYQKSEHNMSKNEFIENYKKYIYNSSFLEPRKVKLIINNLKINDTQKENEKICHENKS